MQIFSLSTISFNPKGTTPPSKVLKLFREGRAEPKKNYKKNYQQPSDFNFSLGGRYTFRCQHGPTECELNQYSTCAYNKLPTDDLKMKFLNCVETNPYTTWMRWCLQSIGADPEPVSGLINIPIISKRGPGEPYSSGIHASSLFS